MKVELINWTEETGGRIVKIDCKINQIFKSFYVLEVEFQKVFIQFKSAWKTGIKLNDDEKIFFIKEFFTI